MPGRPQAHIQQNKDGSISINYQAHENGVHEVNLLCNEQPVDGTPFRCHVDSSGSGYITAYGGGLSQGASGQECSFTVAGGGTDIKVSVDGPAKADITKMESRGGTTNCSFLPMSPGEYEVNIRHKGKHIHGSPFSSKISGEGRKRSQLSMVGSSEVTLGGNNVDLTGMVGTVKTPAGREEQCLLKKMPNGKLGVASFTPKSKGTYNVAVQRNGKDLPESPFKVQVGDGMVCSPAKVKVSGNGMKAAKASAWNDMEIDITNAGIGGLAMSIEGPHRTDLKYEEADNGKKKFNIHFRPHEPGIYLLNVRYGDDHITNSPFVINVGGTPSGRVRETVSKHIQAVGPTGKGSKCEFQLVIPGADPLDMEAMLTSPSGKSELCEIADLPGQLFDIKFQPNDEGVHTISLKQKGLHISGSPFQYTVGTPPAAGPHKVEIGGPGLERGEVAEKNAFNIYTREAGAGQLSVAVEGPSKAAIDVVDRGFGYTTVSYVVAEPGEYGIHVKFDDLHVQQSPLMVNIIPQSTEAKKVSVHSIRDRGLEVGRAATFNVNLNQAQGTLHAHTEGPSNTEEDCFIQELEKDLYAMRYIPKENGIYYVHVLLNEAHIPGSPFTMLVGKMGADPALVMANGPGLEKGITGKANKFTVVTTNSGSGTLLVQIEGPSKTAIVCKEVDEGYEFSYTPMAPGEYLIVIKYTHITIAGCPFMAKVTGTGRKSDINETSALVVETEEKKPGSSAKKRFEGDASKVVAKGNGLKKTFLGRMSNFTIDTKGAGQGGLFMGLTTPSGNVCDELSVKKQRGTNYMVNYKPNEKGEHTLHIRWGQEDIPGSPFVITVG